MRAFNDLNKDAQARVTQYVSQWYNTPTAELAEDLYLKPMTVAAIKANLTRARDRKFNEALRG